MARVIPRRPIGTPSPRVARAPAPESQFFDRLQQAEQFYESPIVSDAVAGAGGLLHTAATGLYDVFGGKQEQLQQSQLQRAEEDRLQQELARLQAERRQMEMGGAQQARRREGARQAGQQLGAAPSPAPARPPQMREVPTTAPGVPAAVPGAPAVAAQPSTPPRVPTGPKDPFTGAERVTPLPYDELEKFAEAAKAVVVAEKKRRAGEGVAEAEVPPTAEAKPVPAAPSKPKPHAGSVVDNADLARARAEEQTGQKFRMQELVLNPVGAFPAKEARRLQEAALQGFEPAANTLAKLEQNIRTGRAYLSDERGRPLKKGVDKLGSMPVEGYYVSLEGRPEELEAVLGPREQYARQLARAGEAALPTPRVAPAGQKSTWQQVQELQSRMQRQALPERQRQLETRLAALRAGREMPLPRDLPSLVAMAASPQVTEQGQLQQIVEQAAQHAMPQTLGEAISGRHRERARQSVVAAFLKKQGGRAARAAESPEKVDQIVKRMLAREQQALTAVGTAEGIERGRRGEEFDREKARFEAGVRLEQLGQAQQDIDQRRQRFELDLQKWLRKLRGRGRGPGREKFDYSAILNAARDNHKTALKGLGNATKARTEAEAAQKAAEKEARRQQTILDRSKAALGKLEAGTPAGESPRDYYSRLGGAEEGSADWRKARNYFNLLKETNDAEGELGKQRGIEEASKARIGSLDELVPLYEATVGAYDDYIREVGVLPQRGVRREIEGKIQQAADKVKARLEKVTQKPPEPPPEAPKPEAESGTGGLFGGAFEQMRRARGGGPTEEEWLQGALGAFED